MSEEYNNFIDHVCDADDWCGECRRSKGLQLIKIADALEQLVKSEITGRPVQAVKIPGKGGSQKRDFPPDSKPLTTVKEVNPGEKKEIVWVEHDGKKFKACRYKCGNYVSWDNDKKKYIHYGQGFGLIGDDCPKYAEVDKQ